MSSGFPYFLRFQSEFGNKEFMVWATVSFQSCFSWLYRASPSLGAKNIINLILVLTIWWCPWADSSLVLSEEGICYDQCILLEKLLAFALFHFVLQGHEQWKRWLVGGHCLPHSLCLTNFSLAYYAEFTLCSLLFPDTDISSLSFFFFKLCLDHSISSL